VVQASHFGLRHCTHVNIYIATTKMGGRERWSYEQARESCLKSEAGGEQDHGFCWLNIITFLLNVILPDHAGGLVFFYTYSIIFIP
jgi:hypothetical protein